jgi:Predicted Permease Membrane Region
VAGLRSSGLSLLFAGLATVILSHLAGVLFGRHVFKMHPGVLLGVCAGAVTATPALAAVQGAAKSSVPTLGYGVGYAVGNVLLALGGGRHYRADGVEGRLSACQKSFCRPDRSSSDYEEECGWRGDDLCRPEPACGHGGELATDAGLAPAPRDAPIRPNRGSE